MCSVASLTLQVCLWLLTIQGCSASGSFFALVPREFHPGQVYNISITAHSNFQDPVKIIAEVSQDSKVYSVSRFFSPGETSILSLMVPENMDKEKATVDIHAVGTTVESRKADLDFNGNTSLVYSETDKVIYKPGDTVLIRIINIDKWLRPVMKPLTAYIVNPNGNKVEEFKQVNSTTGVSERKFQLYDMATEGRWSILVTSNDKPVHTSYFKVEEYVLPKFSVDVTVTPSTLELSPTAIAAAKFVVNAMYTHGKAVQGKCTLTVSASKMSSSVMKDLDEAGTAVFTNIRSPERISLDELTQQLTVRAEVTDVTGRTEVAETSATLIGSSSRLQILDTSTRVLRQGLPTTVHIWLSDLDGRPLMDDRQLQVKVRYTGMSTSFIEEVIEVPANHTVITYTFNIENIEQWNALKKLSSDSSTHVFMSVSRVSKPEINVKLVFQIYAGTGNTIMVQPRENQIIRLDQPAEFIVTHNSNSELFTVGYSVVGRGNILQTGVPVNNVITVTPKQDICPQGHLVVYMMSGSESVLLASDSVSITPIRCFKKEVRVSFDVAESRVSSDVNMQVRVDHIDGSNALPGVHDVYYLAIDKSIVLLQGETGLTEESVMEIQPRTGHTQAPALPYNMLVYASDYFADSGVVGLIIQDEASEPWIRPPDTPSWDVWEEEILPLAGGGRPMMKGSVADQSSSAVNELNPVAEVSSNVKSTVRKNFPDTWLWGHAETAENGILTKKVTLPDTITSWRISAFAINSEGLALCRSPYELTAFQVFFLSMNLPYSVKRGEIFVLRVTVFNYRPQDVDAVVKLQQNENFVLLESQQTDGWNERNIAIPANKATAVEFKISVTTLGLLELYVIAEDMADGMKDQVRRELLVKPEGEERSRAITEALVLPQFKSQLNHTFTIPWPSEDKIVPGSRRVAVKVSGDIFGQALSNLRNLVQIPYGCGEQNMITTVPNIFGLTYIRETGQDVEAEMEEQMLKNMKRGYQREVDGYRHRDGSYSAWGERKSPSGSTWLTAFVVKSFAQASKYMSVEQSILTSGVDFLKKQQNQNGDIRENGQVLHTEMQTGTGTGPALTVYVLVSMLETVQALGSNSLTLDTNINKAVTYIMETLSLESLRQGNSKFLAALTAYALALVPQAQSNVQQFRDDLLQLVIDLGAPWETETVSMKVAADQANGMGNPYMLRPAPSQSIEIAAYYLLALTQLQRQDEGLPIMQWIQSQQNSFGGFSSTQNTVMALQALSVFGASIARQATQGTVVVTDPTSGQTFDVDISGSRSLLLQTVALPNATNIVKVSLSSSQSIMAIVKVVYTYYTQAGDDDQALPEPVVTVFTKSSRVSDNVHKVEACVRSSKSLKYSGMFVTTMNLPSGEKAAEDLATIQANNPQAVNIEIDNEAIHFYMSDPPGEGYCLQAQLERQMEFEVQKPGSARIYAYYEPELSSEVALALQDCSSSQCGGRASSTMLNFASVLLTVVICMLVSLLLCV